MSVVTLVSQELVQPANHLSKAASDAVLNNLSRGDRRIFGAQNGINRLNIIASHRPRRTRSIFGKRVPSRHPGDCLAAKLRPGNVHSAEDWDELLLPEIERQQAEGKQVAFRADAAFAKPEINEALEERSVMYAIRIPANDSLERDIAESLKRPVGRPSHKPMARCKGFLYQAASWKTARPVVAKVEFPFGELFPRVGFIVTNLSLPSRAVVRFYNKRGTAEQWIKASRRHIGPGYRAIGSEPMKHVYS
jgi:Transposase DDE domain group 1